MARLYQYHSNWPRRKNTSKIKNDKIRTIKNLLKTNSVIDVANMPEYKDSLSLESIWDIFTGKICSYVKDC